MTIRIRITYLCMLTRWKGSGNPREFAEICRCRESMCRGLIAEKGCPFFASSTAYYEGEVTRLQEEHNIAEKALQHRYEDLAAAERVGSNTVVLEMDLIRKENELGKLKANIELIIAAVARSRASKASWMPSAKHVQVPESRKNYLLPLKNVFRKIRALFSHVRKPKSEQLAQVTIETSESNPYFVPDSAPSSYRSALVTSARSSVERAASFTPKDVYSARASIPVLRLPLPPRPRFLIE